MPGGNSTSRPKNRKEKTAMKKRSEVVKLMGQLKRAEMNGEITEGAYKRAVSALKPAYAKANKEGIYAPMEKEETRKAGAKYMTGATKTSAPARRITTKSKKK